MPRIPVRTTPYHSLPRCTRHYKSKRDLMLRSLGKASFINGSQFVIAWISPRGEVDIYASDLLQNSISTKEGVPVVNKKDLEREAARVKPEMAKRWDEIRRLEEAGEAPTLEEDEEVSPENEEVEDEGDDENMDADRTMVDDSTPLKFAHQASSAAMPSSSVKRPSPTHMMSSFSTARASTPSPPMHTITLAPDAIDAYYTQRFSALQQATCKLVVKAWIKVIEPKKQMKFPYNKGEDLKPTWWPEGVRHREPDHLSKQERLVLLGCIVRSPLVTVSRLELSTAEAGAFISRPRQSILREVYLVAKEEEKRRKENDQSSDLIVHLPNAPVSPSQVSPEMPEKRSRSAVEDSASSLDKENIVLSASSYAAHAQKRMKQSAQPPRLAPLTTSAIANYDPYSVPFTYAPSPNTWRPEATLAVPPPHLSPYPTDWSNPGSDYSRSPNPETADRYHSHATHLAPIMNTIPSHNGSADQSMYAHSANMQGINSQPGSATYYGRGYMQQQQQMDYLQHNAHPGYDYGSPYLTDATWENPFNTQAAQ